MVTLPKDFVATKYDGYFWHLEEQKLYSIKVGGVLRPLVKPRISKYTYGQDVYQVSNKGKSRFLFIDELLQLKAKNSVIKVEKA